MLRELTSTFEGKRVIITGGLGFIGSNLAMRLVSMGADVLLIDSLIPEYGGNLRNIEPVRNRVQINISDVRDRYGLAALIKGRDFLFNLAGQTSHVDSMTDPETDLEINCRAQLSILETCREVNPDIRVVFASTRQIYGKPDYLPVDERHLLRPVDVNGINKMAGEWYHILYNNVYGLHACALRLTNTIGPRMRIKDARQTFLGIWIRLLLEGKTFEVWGGEQLRDFNYVDDAVEAFLMAAADEKAFGHVFNLGSREVVNLKQLAEMLVEANGNGEFRVREYPRERKVIDIGDYYSDFSRIEDLLGWQPRTTLRESLRLILKYYRDNWTHYV